jgi:hypothetical protein
MFFDASGPGPFGEPHVPTCKSCRGPIASGQATEHLNFQPDAEYKLEELNGIYHAACAKPLLSVARAIHILGRGFN